MSTTLAEPGAPAPPLLEVGVGLRQGNKFYGSRDWIASSTLVQRLPSLSLVIPEFRASAADALHLRYLGILGASAPPSNSGALTPVLDFDCWDNAMLKRFGTGETPLCLFRSGGEDGDEVLDFKSLPSALSEHLAGLIGDRARKRKFGAPELIRHMPLLSALWDRVSTVCKRLLAANVALDLYYSGAKGFRVLVRAPELFYAVVHGDSTYGDAAVAIVERFLVAKGCTEAEVTHLLDKSPFGPNKGTKPDMAAHPVSRLWPQLVDIDGGSVSGTSSRLTSEDKLLSARIAAFAGWLVCEARSAWPRLATLPRVGSSASAKRELPAPSGASASSSSVSKKARTGARSTSAAAAAVASSTTTTTTKSVKEPLYEFPKAATVAGREATHFAFRGEKTSYRYVDAASLPRLYAQLAASTAPPNCSNERMSDVTRLVVDYDAGPPLRAPCAALGGVSPLAAMQRLLASDAIFSPPPSAAELDCVIVETKSRPNDAAGTQRAKIYWPSLHVVRADGAAVLRAIAAQLATVDVDAGGYAESSDDDGILVADSVIDEGDASVARSAASVCDVASAVSDGSDDDIDDSDDDSSDDSSDDSDGSDESDSESDAGAPDWSAIIDPQPYENGGLRMPLADSYDKQRHCLAGRAHRFDPLHPIEFDAAARPVPPERRRCQSALKLLYATSLREESALYSADGVAVHGIVCGWMPRGLAPAAAAFRLAAAATATAAGRRASPSTVLPAELRDAVTAELRADACMAPLFADGGALRVAKRFNGRLYIDSTQRGCPNAPLRVGVRAHTSRTLYVVVEPVGGLARPSMRCRCDKERVGACGTTCAELRVDGAPLSTKLSRLLFAHLAAVTLDECHAALPLVDVLGFAAQQQLGDAKMLHALIRDRLVYDGAEARFYTWVGTHWEADVADVVLHVACGAIMAQYKAASAALVKKDRARAAAEAAAAAASDDDGDADDDSDNEKPASPPASAKPRDGAKMARDGAKKSAPIAAVAQQAAALSKRVAKVGTSAYISGVLRLAAPLFCIKNSRWEGDTYMLFCANGAAVSLRTGESRPAEPSDLNRVMCASEYRGLAEPAPLFRAALEQIFHVDALGLAREAARELIDDGLDAPLFVERMQRLGANVSGDVKACARAAEALVRAVETADAAAAAAQTDPDVMIADGAAGPDADGEALPAVASALTAFCLAFTAAVPAQPGALELAFVQELFGASLLGEVPVQQLAVHYGKRGANGKSVLFETIGDTLGRDVARPVPVEALLVANQAGAGPSPYVASLRGLRLAWCSEPEDSAQLSGGQIKLLTGADSVTARHLYGHPITFTPSHSLHLVTNHLLSAPGDDEAFWRRVVVLQYHNRFVERPARANERAAQPDLKRRIVADEAPGVLAWLVAGCVRFLARGARFDVPPSARAVTQRYERSQSELVQFAADRCTMAPTARANAAALRAAYEAWAVEKKRAPLSAQDFSARLCELDGVARRRTATGFIYDGIALRK
jgi:P4 family phage/plasmid primase-like protien